MKQFLGVHKMGDGPLTSDQTIADSFHGYQAAAKNMGLNATHVHYSVKKGFGYCITEANSADEVLKAHQVANVPVEEVIEVKTI